MKFTESKAFMYVILLLFFITQLLFSLHTPYLGAPSFSKDPTLVYAVISFFLGLTFFALFDFSISENKKNVDEDSKSSSKTNLIIISIIILGFLLRYYRYTSYPAPVHDDEVNIALDAIGYSEGRFNHLWEMGWYQTPAFLSMINSFVMKFFPKGLESIRASSVIFSSLNLVIFFFLSRQLFGVILAVVSTSFFAFQFWHLLLSRWASYAVILTFFTTLVFYLISKCFNLTFIARDQSQKVLVSFIYALFAGIVLAICMYIYIPSRLIALAVFFFLVFNLLITFFNKGNVKQCILLSLVLGIVYLLLFYPLAQSYIKNQELFFARWNEISLPAKMNLSGDLTNWANANWSILFDNISSYLLMLNYSSNHVTRHGIPNMPLLNVVSGVLFLFGFSSLLLNLFKKRSLMIILWLVMPLVGGVITVSETPSPFRTIAACPAVALICTVPFIYLKNLFASEKKYLLFVVLFCSSSCLINVNKFVKHISNYAQYRNDFHNLEYSVAKDISTNEEDSVSLVSKHFHTFSSNRFFNPDKKYIKQFNFFSQIPYTEKVFNNLYLYPSSHEESLISALSSYYPNLKIIKKKNIHGQTLAYTKAIIPNKDLKFSNGFAQSKGRDNVYRAVFKLPVGNYVFKLKNSLSKLIIGSVETDSEKKVKILKELTNLTLTLEDEKNITTLPEVYYKRGGSDKWRELSEKEVFKYPYDRYDQGLRQTVCINSDSKLEDSCSYNIVTMPFLPSHISVPKPFSISWQGFITFPKKDIYHFNAIADDGCRLWVDDKIVLERGKWESEANNFYNPVVTDKDKTKVKIKIDFYELGGARDFNLLWSSSEMKEQAISGEYFSID